MVFFFFWIKIVFSSKNGIYHSAEYIIILSQYIHDNKNS